MADTSQGFLAASVRVTNDDGTLTPEFRTFLQSLWERTGGGAGGDITNVAATAAAALASASASLKKLQNLDDVDDKPTSRSNLGLGSIAIGDTQPGWDFPTGNGSRATFDMNYTIAISNPPTQAQVQSILSQLIIVQKNLGQAIIDLQTARVLGQ